MFIDEIEIEVCAGSGGSGKVSFHREKFVQKGKPDGGDGGRGGSVIFIARSNLSTLNHLASITKYRAESGKPGGTNNMYGSSGDDLKIFVPVGTVIREVVSQDILFDFTVPDEEYIAAKGGKGGLGNFHFRSSVNRSPRYAQQGEKGESGRIKLELKLIADVGLVGFPNAGKSTLLSVISDAKPKIADYPFTTISPNLGVANYRDRNFLVADIPGLIENAHRGAGLGLSFLRHIERTAVIVYILDISESGAFEKYLMLKKELKHYNEELMKRPSAIVLNKIDIDGAKRNAKIVGKNFKSVFFEISALKKIGLDKLLRELVKILGKRKDIKKR